MPKFDTMSYSQAKKLKNLKLCMFIEGNLMRKSIDDIESAGRQSQ